MLLSSALVPKLLNSPFASCSFIHLELLPRHKAHFDNNIDLSFLVFNTFKFIFSVLFLHYKQYVNMFYNGLYMKSLGLILLCFCFTNLDLSDIQLAHFDFCLITLFDIVTFFEPILLVWFYSLNNKFACFYNVDNICLTILFKHFI